MGGNTSSQNDKPCYVTTVRPCLSNETCMDTKDWKDEKKASCLKWKGFNCLDATTKYGYTEKGRKDLLDNCPVSCGFCASSSGSIVDEAS